MSDETREALLAELAELVRPLSIIASPQDLAELVRALKLRRLGNLLMQKVSANPGSVGVLGPTRMNYQKVIPLVNFTAQVLSRVLEQEHRIYPQAVRWFCEDRIRLTAAGEVTVEGAGTPAGALISPSPG